ncbi:hypothetical protein NPS01_27560 [Nocardioides psychrotolerans]|uniref:Uncharacterized membrane protein YcfT n=1 Tax=Nocardioides psychrotolerans TaxID=1005945 RepID=A0A1I3RJU4_9ACTN|nr:acyltransferase family protein [Nocardioides psychrotolerans]GEP39093.1 hypothetical protein NPS01_27560 [Nocardioides psychrotolerans]SFJ46300.1 Uncharacterized membrane protein YcfT [Nocardioides psychrotolerans]
MDTRPPARRLRWADIAKGGCILLVVLHHVVGKHLVAVVPDDLAVVAVAWSGVSGALRPVRMPLFFVLSGFFASGAVHRPWPTVRRRVTSPAYVYVVWLVILGLFFTWEQDLVTNRTQDLGELALDLLLASTALWFLYALAVYFLVVRLTRRVPAYALVMVGGLVALGAAALPIEEANRVSLLVHLVYFVVGSRCPGLVTWLAGLGVRRLLPVGVLVLLAGSGVMALLGLPSPVRVVLLSVVGVPVGLWLAAGLARAAPGARVTGALAWTGRRTLPVYVLHLPVLGALHHVLDVPAADGASTLSRAAAVLLAAAYPFAVTALVIAVSLVAHRVLVGLGLGLLFELPRLPRLAAQRQAATRRQIGEASRTGRATTTMLDRYSPSVKSVQVTSTSRPRPRSWPKSSSAAATSSALE